MAIWIVLIYWLYRALVAAAEQPPINLSSNLIQPIQTKADTLPQLGNRRVSASSQPGQGGLPPEQPLKHSKNRLHKQTNSAVTVVNTQLSIAVEQWLQQFAQAEVNLDFTRHASPQGSIALLFPWYQSEQQQLFTQWVIHRGAAKNSTWSAGLGQRWLQGPDAFWGYNFFYDQRTQGRHRSLGIGLELRKSALALAVNGYWPLSTWREINQGRDRARPASGLEICLQSYWPADPRLGFTLMGERHFGSGVALFSQDKRQANPSALTIGVEYLWLPLLTPGYAFKLGQEANLEAYKELLAQEKKRNRELSQQCQSITASNDQLRKGYEYYKEFYNAQINNKNKSVSEKRLQKEYDEILKKLEDNRISHDELKEKYGKLQDDYIDLENKYKN